MLVKRQVPLGYIGFFGQSQALAKSYQNKSIFPRKKVQPTQGNEVGSAKKELELFTRRHTGFGDKNYAGKIAAGYKTAEGYGCS